MKCPVCNIALTMSDRQGIEIDYCPQCRGVWLDRGELDKIIERSTSYQQVEDRGRSEDKREYEEKSKHHGHDHEHKYKHKKKSFFEEIFD
jgi:hypothetical protein